MGTPGPETKAKPDHREHGEGGEWKKRNTVLANCNYEQKLDSKINRIQNFRITVNKKFKQQKKNKKQTEQQRLKNKTRDPIPWLIQMKIIHSHKHIIEESSDSGNTGVYYFLCYLLYIIIIVILLCSYILFLKFLVVDQMWRQWQWEAFMQQRTMFSLQPSPHLGVSLNMCWYINTHSTRSIPLLFLPFITFWWW